MTDNPVPERDPCEAFLEATPSPASPSWREALRQRTTTMLRWRAWARRIGFIGALAGCYLAGLATMWLTTKPVPAPPPAAAPEEPSPVHPSTEPPMPAVALEFLAFDGSGRPAELYRQAGDSYIEAEHDVAAALRCYRQALDRGTDLTVSAEDSWLLMTLKEARRKEQEYEKQRR